MRTLKRTVLVLVFTLLAGCGQQLVEFANPSVPTVTSTDPLNTATGVGVSQSVNATFSEKMDPATITADTFTLKQGTTPIPGAVSYAGTTATFRPTTDLSSNVFTASISTGAKSGANQTGLGAAYTWTFTTGPPSTSAPTVTLTDPLNAATGVVVNKKISATFSRAMNPASITASTFTLNQGANAVAGALTYVGTTATFTPSGDLSAGTIYAATITTGAKDASGNAIQADYLWSFTTAAFADVTPPTVTVTSPLDNAINV